MPRRELVKAEAKAAKIIIILWAIATFLTPTIIALTGGPDGTQSFLCKIKFLGFPFHYWLVAQGKISLTIILMIIFIFILASLGYAAEAKGGYKVGEELFQLKRGFKLIPAIIMVAFIVLIVGWVTRVKTTEGYWVAERSIGSVGNGMAIASDWRSAASFMGVAGLLYLKGWFGLAYIIGWTGGYVLLLCLMAS